MRTFLNHTGDDTPMSFCSIQSTKKVGNRGRDDGIIRIGVDGTEDLEGMRGAKGRAFSCSEVGLEGMAEAAIGVLVGFEGVENGCNGCAIESTGEPGDFERASGSLDKFTRGIEGI